MNNRRFERAGELNKLVMCVRTASPAQHGHTFDAVEHCREAFDGRARRSDRGHGQQQRVGTGDGGLEGGLQGNVTGNDDDADATLGDGAADCNLENAAHLRRARDKLTIAATFDEQPFWMGFLKVAGADLG